MRNVKIERGIFPRVKEVYFQRLKEGNTNFFFGKDEGYEENEMREKFYFKR